MPAMDGGLFLNKYQPRQKLPSNGPSITEVEALLKECFAQRAKPTAPALLSLQASIWVQAEWPEPVMVCYRKSFGSLTRPHGGVKGWSQSEHTIRNTQMLIYTQKIIQIHFAKIESFPE